MLTWGCLNSGLAPVDSVGLEAINTIDACCSAIDLNIGLDSVGGNLASAEADSIGLSSPSTDTASVRCAKEIRSRYLQKLDRQQ